MRRRLHRATLTRASPSVTSCRRHQVLPVNSLTNWAGLHRESKIGASHCWPARAKLLGERLGWQGAQKMEGGAARRHPHRHSHPRPRLRVGFLLRWAPVTALSVSRRHTRGRRQRRGAARRMVVRSRTLNILERPRFPYQRRHLPRMLLRCFVRLPPRPLRHQAPPPAIVENPVGDTLPRGFRMKSGYAGARRPESPGFLQVIGVRREAARNRQRSPRTAGNPAEGIWYRRAPTTASRRHRITRSKNRNT